MQHLMHKVLHGFLSWPDGFCQCVGVVKVSASGRGRKEGRDARPRVCVFRPSGCPPGERYRRLREKGKRMCEGMHAWLCFGGYDRTLSFGQIVHDCHHDTSPRADDDKHNNAGCMHVNNDCAPQHKKNLTHFAMSSDWSDTHMASTAMRYMWSDMLHTNDNNASSAQQKG